MLNSVLLLISNINTIGPSSKDCSSKQVVGKCFGLLELSEERRAIVQQLVSQLCHIVICLCLGNISHQHCAERLGNISSSLGAGEIAESSLQQKVAYFGVNVNSEGREMRGNNVEEGASIKGTLYKQCEFIKSELFAVLGLCLKFAGCGGTGDRVDIWSNGCRRNFRRDETRVF